jgi:CrcB protein
MMPHARVRLKSRPRLRAVPSPRSPLILAAVAVGGIVGALGRYGIARAVRWDGIGFPWATFLTNVIGCIAIGLLVVGLVEREGAAPWERPLLVTGLLGGFTTYSTFALEVRDLIAVHRGSLALLYVAATLLCGIAAVALARAIVLRAGGAGNIAPQGAAR